MKNGKDEDKNAKATATANGEKETVICVEISWKWIKL